MSVRHALVGLICSSLLVAVLTAVLVAVVPQMDLGAVTVIYLVPIMISATWLGTVPALASAVGAVLCLAYFYPPSDSLYVANRDHVINLVVFTATALLTSYLASVLREQAAISARREAETARLYAFSRKLAIARDAREIYRAIEEHLSSIVRRRVILFGTAHDIREHASACSDGEIPPRVQEEACAILASRNSLARMTVADAGRGAIWFLRCVSTTTSDFGVVAVDVGKSSPAVLGDLVKEIEAALYDAAQTLEQLDVGRAIHEAQVRAETDMLREALIGSVSHDLRTPLSAILCATTVLSTVPAVSKDERTRTLVQIIQDEAERHNEDIQDLLDATRISTRGVRPQLEWTDPTDILNSALERFNRRHRCERTIVELPPDLPLIYVDSSLIEQALFQIVDNAAKYSPPDSKIQIRLHSDSESMSATIRDEGIGLTETEGRQILDRFFRGERAAASSSGSGLGLWIANAFVSAHGGRIETSSPGAGCGTTVSIRLPLTHQEAVPQLEEVADA